MGLGTLRGCSAGGWYEIKCTYSVQPPSTQFGTCRPGWRYLCDASTMWDHPPRIPQVPSSPAGCQRAVHISLPIRVGLYRPLWQACTSTCSGVWAWHGAAPASVHHSGTTLAASVGHRAPGWRLWPGSPPCTMDACARPRHAWLTHRNGCMVATANQWGCGWAGLPGYAPAEAPAVPRLAAQRWGAAAPPPRRGEGTETTMACGYECWLLAPVRAQTCA